jgi:chemotaxis signal transduction protein
VTSLPRGIGRSGAAAPQALFFRLGEAQLALPAHQVAAVAEVAGCTPIPSSDPALLGVARVGRRLLPLVDAHRRLHLAGQALTAFPRTCVVVNGALGEVAFPIDAVLGLRSVPGGRLPVGCALMPLEQLIDGGPDVVGQE